MPICLPKQHLTNYKEKQFQDAIWESQSFLWSLMYFKGLKAIYKLSVPQIISLWNSGWSTLCISCSVHTKIPISWACEGRGMSLLRLSYVFLTCLSYSWKKSSGGKKTPKEQQQQQQNLKERKLCSKWRCPCTTTCITCGPSVVKKCAKKDMGKPPHNASGSSLKRLWHFVPRWGAGCGGNHLCFPHHSFIATSLNLKKSADSENCIF